MKKVLIYLLMISVLLMPLNVLAEENETRKITKEDIANAYKKLLLETCEEGSTEDLFTAPEQTYGRCEFFNSDNFSIDDFVTDDSILFINDGNDYYIEYEINDNGKVYFSKESTVTNGMTYDEFEEEVSMQVLPFVGEMIVAIANGASVEEAESFVTDTLFRKISSIFTNLFDENTTTKPAYIILEDNETYDGDTTDVLVFHKSEVPDHIIDIAKAVYGNSPTITSAYLLGITRFEQVDDDEATIKTTIGVNQNMDLEVIKEIAKSYNQKDDDKEETEEEQNEEKLPEETIKKSVDPTENKKDTSTVINPKTSITFALITIPILIGISFLIRTIRYKKRISKI